MFTAWLKVRSGPDIYLLMTSHKRLAHPLRSEFADLGAHLPTMTSKTDMSNSPKTPHVAICIATYRRPAGLRALLQSLDALVFEKVQPEITLVIADNYPETPASRVAGDIAALTRWPTIYVLEPVRGIVAARNRTLDAAPKNADLIAFLDDDETVSAGWLERMILTMNDTGATAVYGPVYPIFEATPPRWVEDLKTFQTGPFPQGKHLVFAATNNALVDAAFLRDNDLHFDFRFNETGGEDQEMFGRLQDAGGVIRASTNAAVYDAVPAARMTLRWVLRRAYRTGNTLGRIAIIRQRGRGERFAKGLGTIGKGIVLSLGVGLFSKAFFIKGLMELSRGSGMLAGLVNIHFAEYSLTAVKLDRSSES